MISASSARALRAATRSGAVSRNHTLTSAARWMTTRTGSSGITAMPLPQIRSINMTSRAGDLRPRSKVVTRTSASSRRNNSTSNTSKPSQKCPSCSAAVLLPQSPCPNCSALLPLPSNLSHHSILFLSNPVASSSASASLDISQELANTPANGYDIDKAALKKNWLLRQRELHPDKYQAKDDGEKSVSLARELSGRVNEAYNVLKDDLKRADYILSLHSRETEETDKIDDPMMLAEILEAREELEEASSQDEVDRIRADNHEKVVETTSRLSQAFAQNPPDLHEAKNLAIQLRYWRGLEDAAKDKVI